MRRRKPGIRESILEFIPRSIDEKGYAPTVRDIMKCPSMLDALIDDGDIVVMEAMQTIEDGEVVGLSGQYTELLNWSSA